MFYKVIKNGKPLDVLDKLQYVKYQPKHKILLLTSPAEAQGVLSSDGKYAYHDFSLIACEDMIQVEEIVEIDKYEYEKLKMLNLTDAQAIIDSFLLSLIESGVL